MGKPHHCLPPTHPNSPSPTSVEAYSLSHRQHEHRTTATSYAITLKWKLHLPILTHAPIPLKYPFSDILDAHVVPSLMYMVTTFSIANQHRAIKPLLHNHMRDTLLHILGMLGPLAGWTNHNYDVAQEPTQLLPI
jgi:hypothetical protein